MINPLFWGQDRANLILLGLGAVGTVATLANFCRSVHILDGIEEVRKSMLQSPKLAARRQSVALAVSM